MKLAAPVVSVVACAVAAAFTMSAAPLQTQALNPPCPNTLRHEPLVVFEVTGGTLAGPVDSLLAVYDDGLARYSSSIGPGPGFSYTVGVGEAQARGLQADLAAAGALYLCDASDGVVNDVPLSTLTVLRGQTRQAGNTFSWFLPEGPTATIEGVLSAFIAAHFPAPPGGGGGF